MMASNATYLFCIIACILLPYTCSAQYATEAGTAGTDAIHADSCIIKKWASGCSVARGFMQIDDTPAGKASGGNESDCLGKADNISVSLGDSGVAVIVFDEPVPDIPGPDFAVYENSFDGQFLELAFVEVSTDSMRWIRFPSVSLTQNTSQTGTFGTTKPESVKNLAGKYKAFYGTPFDLSELKDSAGIDLQNVRYIRIIDVIGNIADPFASFDTYHNRINDPWPTPFPQSGFDLDAVAILQTVTGKPELAEQETVQMFPNPASGLVTIKFRTPGKRRIMLFDTSGCLKISVSTESTQQILDVSMLMPGIYLVRTDNDGSPFSQKLLIE